MQNLKCKKCNLNLVTKVVSGITVQTCNSCGLVFVDGIEVNRLRNGYIAINNSNNIQNYNINNVKIINEKCPYCGVDLKSEECIKNSGISFKLCQKCLSIIFEPNELNKLKNYQISANMQIDENFEDVFYIMKRLLAS